MGLRAIDAVQRYSRYRHDKAEGFIPYRIMIAIAWYADDNGIAGAPGEPKRCPTIDTIARRAAVHRNTVLNWLPQIKESGELATEKHGTGRGSHVIYSILLDVDLVPLPDNGTNDHENSTGNQRDDIPINQYNDGALAEIRELLVHQNELLVQVLAQSNGTNGTSLQSDDVPDPSDPYIDPSDPEDPLPPEPPKEDAYSDVMFSAALTYFGNDVRKSAIVLQALVRFSEITRIKQPYLNGDRAAIKSVQQDWLQPIDHMLTEAEGSVEVFAETVGQVVQEADRPDGFTLSSPKSTVKTFNSILAQKRRGVYRSPIERARNGNGHKPTAAELEAAGIPDIDWAA